MNTSEVLPNSHCTFLHFQKHITDSISFLQTGFTIWKRWHVNSARRDSGKDSTSNWHLLDSVIPNLCSQEHHILLHFVNFTSLLQSVIICRLVTICWNGLPVENKFWQRTCNKSVDNLQQSCLQQAVTSHVNASWYRLIATSCCKMSTDLWQLAHFWLCNFGDIFMSQNDVLMKWTIPIRSPTQTDCQLANHISWLFHDHVTWKYELTFHWEFLL